MTKSRCVCVRKRAQSLASVAHARQLKMVAKSRTVGTFGLAFGPRVSKNFRQSQVSGGPGREAQK